MLYYLEGAAICMGSLYLCMLFCIGVTVIEYTVVPKYLVLGRSGVSARVRPGEGDPAGMWLYIIDLW